MYKITRLTALTLLSLSTLADSPKLEKLLEQRLKLYQEITLAKTQWQAEELAYKERIALKLSQIAQVHKEKQKLAEKSKAELSKRQKFSQEKEKYLSLVKQMQNELDETQKSLTDIIKTLPKPLAKLIPMPASATQSLLERSQTLSSIAKDLQKIQSQSHLVKESLEINGKTQEYRVLYLGSALAYFISHDGLSAGIITYQQGQWTPQVHNDLASEINKAITVQQGKAKPELLQLLLPTFTEEAK